MSDSRPFAIQSWADVYHKLRAKAEATRGTVTVAPYGGPSAIWPHTTSRDAFAIAVVFDTAIEDHTSAAMVARWIVESDLLAGEPDDSTEPYLGNRSLWDTLAAASGELDRVHAPLPDLSVIDDAMRELETARPAPSRDRRNAAATMFVTVFAEPSWRAMATRQLEFFQALRGSHAGSEPFAPSVPATSNADVLALADYWTDELARIGDNARDTFQRVLYSSWRDVVHRVLRECKHAPAHERCTHNPEFWISLLLLTTQSDACDAAPMPWAYSPSPSPSPSPSNAVLDETARMQRDGLSRLRGEDVVTGRLISRVPRTTVDDVRRLAAYWSSRLAAVGDTAPGDVSYRHVIDRWNASLAQVARISQDADPGSVYAHNIEFWEALVTIAIHITATAGAGSGPESSHRNAAPVDTGAAIVFPAAQADDAARMQRDELSRLRGEDVVTGRLISRVPRTTVADVRQLAGYWSGILANVGEHSFADISSRHVIERWKKAVAEVAGIPQDVDPNSVYAHNTDFWEALVTISIQIATTAAAPTRWELVKQATWQAVKDLPHTLKTAAQDFWSDILAKPLISLGIGVGGVALLYLLLRRSNPETRR